MLRRPRGARQVFAAVARTDTAIEALIQRGLVDVGKTADTELTAFTDGCSGLRSILLKAGVTKPPLLDWFHIAMRLQHAEKTASTLPADTPERENARAVIVAEVDRLHWRIWNGKAKDAKVTIERIRQVMPVFQGEQGDRKRDPSSRRLCARDRPLSDRPGRLAGQLCRAPSCRFAGRHVDHGRHRQLPGQPPHEQIAADAMVAPRRRSPAPVRRLQRQARFQLRPAVPGRRSRLRADYGGLPPNRSAVPVPSWASRSGPSSDPASGSPRPMPLTC